MKNNKLSTGLIYLSVNNRQRLVHAVLKKLSISPTDDRYDDLFQEGCLIFAEAFAHHPDPVHDERQLMNFAFKRIYWRLLDQLRRTGRQTATTALSLDDEQQSPDQVEQCLHDATSQRPFDRLEHATFIEQLWQACNPSQRRYLYACLCLDYRDSEIADYYHVSRQAVAGWKRGVISKARRIVARDHFDYNEGA